MSALSWSAELDLSAVSERPGVYLFKDESQRVLYVGKAANLRARLRSYKRAGGDGRLFIRFMEREARTVETIVTRTEQEALLLEDSLIKTHKPPHNIRLKDDKSFLMLRLDPDERFPRFKYVRAHNPGKSASGGRARFFGPFATASALRRTLSDLHRVVPMRDCPDSVMNHRSRPCLKHQMGLCAAPCVGWIGPEQYAEFVERAVRILSGETAELEGELEARMKAAAAEMEYERAAAWRDRLAALRRTVEGQGVTPRDRVARDVLNFARKGDEAVIQRLSFRDGRLAESRSHTFRSELPDEELLHGAITALYASGAREIPAELVLPCEPAGREIIELALRGAHLVVPKSGERKRMLDLAGDNARAELARRAKEKTSEEAALEELAKLLDLESPPEVIDCFDISNFQGSNVVASRVRMRAGHADRAGYRRFRVRGTGARKSPRARSEKSASPESNEPSELNARVDASERNETSTPNEPSSIGEIESRDSESVRQDDFAAMREVVYRSLKRGADEDDLPDLVVIDGGAQQLASALEAREEAGAWGVVVIALAKARRERTVKGARKSAVDERVFLPGAKEPIELARHSAARHLLERIRDEAHRFAITYHRKERGKIRSQMDSIPGVGPKKRRALLTRFGSVAGVKAASVEELAAVEGIGAELARTIREHLLRE